MSRVFVSHSSRDNRPAVAVKKWLIEQEPGLAEVERADRHELQITEDAQRPQDAGLRVERIAEVHGLVQ